MTGEQGREQVDEVLAVLDATADAVARALGTATEWGPSGLRPTQYQSDLTADAAALAVLDEAGFGVVSEESGVRRPDAPVWVALDPLDGSTNAHRRLPWYACSVAAVDADGPLAAVVLNLATSVRYRAVRGGGATRDGVPIKTSGCAALGDAVVALSGLPPRHLGWAQFRCMGAAALDLCAVADGTTDGFVDCSPDAHGVWDYLAGALVLREAGGVVGDAFARSLAPRAHEVRRTPIGAASAALHAALVEARSTW